MRIKALQTALMGVPSSGGQAPRRNWIFLRVQTDQGITGIGEATTESHEHAVVAMIEQHFAPMLIGEDPTRINYLWQQMQRRFWWRGGVAATSALSAIDQALWDIAGKAYGQPVYRLLGGAVRDRVRVYARGDLGLPTPAAELAAALGEGFTAFKFGPGRYVQPFDEEKQVDCALALARELRHAGGADCDLMIDCQGVFSLQAAHRLIQGLDEVRTLFVEEPVNADTPRSLAALRRAFPRVRIAAGERQMTRWGFREWLEMDAVDVIQPDVSHCGGISELLRIAAGAEVYNLAVAPHNPYGPVALAASVHACAAMQNFLILEHCRHRPWFDEVQKFGPRVQAGCVLLPDRPGLGVELDWDYVNGHPYQRLEQARLIDRDSGMPSM
jgi:galactonate dehydratase